MAKEPVSEIAGQRLVRARKLYKLSQIRLLEFERWQKCFPDINNDKSIRKWEKEGVPLDRIDDLSTCFRVPGSYFLSDKIITDKDFETAVQLRKEDKCLDLNQLSLKTTVQSFDKKFLEDLKRGIDANLNNSKKIIGMFTDLRTKGLDANYHESIKVYTEAICFVRDGNLKKAKKKLERSIILNPNLPTALHLLCYIHTMEKDFDSVELYLTKLKKFNIEFSEDYIIKGYVNLLKFYVDPAIENFDKGLRLGNRTDSVIDLWNPTTICTIQGLLYFYKEDYSEAKRYFEEYFKIGSENQSVLTALYHFLLGLRNTNNISCSYYYCIKFIELLFQPNVESGKFTKEYKPNDWIEYNDFKFLFPPD